MMNEITLNEAEQRTILNEAQLGILRLLGRLKTVEQVNELRQIISNYYAQKATEEMDSLWDAGEWDAEKNEAVLNEHLRQAFRCPEGYPVSQTPCVETERIPWNFDVRG
jgi:hypothetical protein